MTLSQARLRIGAIIAALGLTAFDLDKLLLPIVTALGIPPAVLDMPGPVKFAVIVGFAIYALVVTKRTSENNPDGTPATERYDAGKEVL
jgi:hypothetical protein